MQIQETLFLALVDPVNLKPVGGASRIAVKPPGRSLNRTAGRCLVNETLRHQRNLIKKGACCRNTLYQVLGAFVLAAKDKKIICFSIPADFQHVREISGNMIFPVIPAAGKHQLQILQHVTFKGADGLARHDKILAIIPCHCPHDKRQAHAHRFS